MRNGKKFSGKDSPQGDSPQEDFLQGDSPQETSSEDISFLPRRQFEQILKGPWPKIYPSVAVVKPGIATRYIEPDPDGIDVSPGGNRSETSETDDVYSAETEVPEDDIDVPLRQRRVFNDEAGGECFGPWAGKSWREWFSQVIGRLTYTWNRLREDGARVAKEREQFRHYLSYRIQSAGTGFSEEPPPSSSLVGVDRRIFGKQAGLRPEERREVPGRDDIGPTDPWTRLKYLSHLSDMPRPKYPDTFGIISQMRGTDIPRARARKFLQPLDMQLEEYNRALGKTFRAVRWLEMEIGWDGVEDMLDFVSAKRSNG